LARHPDAAVIHQEVSVAQGIANLARAFPDEVRSSFAFLAADFGWPAPVIPDPGPMASALFDYGDAAYRVSLDGREGRVETTFSLRRGRRTLVAHLPALVATQAGRAQRVPSRVHSLRDLHNVLQAQAALVRQVHPLLAGVDAADFLVRAGARELGPPGP
jgi:hypothetical protein